MHKPNSSIENYYRLGRVIGKPGFYGYACEAFKIGTDEKFAVKIIPHRNKKPHIRDTQDEQMFKREMQLIQFIDHPNVVKGYEMFQDDKATYLVMELCAGGELFDRIKEKADAGCTFSEMDAADIIRQVCHGLSCLHAHNIAHCDIKPDNILFTADWQVKIIDFNLSKCIEPLRYERGMTGTPYYVAPEIINGKYTYHCDMWSVGVVMFMLLFGYPPFSGDLDRDILRQISRDGFDPSVKSGYGPWFPETIPVSAEAKHLLRGLLERYPVKRLSANEALQHPWLNGRAPGFPMMTNVLTNLGNYLSSHALKLKLLSFLSESSRVLDHATCRHIFSCADTNGDGIITLAEMTRAMTLSGSSFSIDDLFSRADLDGDGKLSYEDFMLALVHNRLVQKQERLLGLFQQLDTDRDGFLSPRDIYHIVAPLNPKAVLAEIDSNGDGLVDYKDFLSMFATTDGVPTPPRAVSKGSRHNTPLNQLHVSRHGTPPYLQTAPLRTFPLLTPGAMASSPASNGPLLCKL